MAFFNSFKYSSAGKGVEKNAPKKRRFILFIEIAFRKIWQLMGINLLWLLMCIPLLTIGPATAGLMKVMRNFSQERHSYVISDFFKAYKNNFKKSMFFGIIDLLILASTICSFFVYPQLADYYDSYAVYIPMIITISIAFTVMMMNYYVYLMIIATDISTKNIIKNSFYLTCIALKKNLITTVLIIAILAVFGFLIFFWPQFIILLLIMPFSLIALIIAFNSYPVIQEHVINPYYEERGEVNPEISRYMPDDDEAIFEDMGGIEAPIEMKNDKPETKGKTKHLK